MSEEEFVTVVSVEDRWTPYVTVVEVQEPSTASTEEPSADPPVEEVVQIYRLPGERLGFGLKFDGSPTVVGLTVESTAEASPSARARASWGPLGPGDVILEVDGRSVAGMTRQEVVTRLTESGLVVKLRVRRGPPPVPPRRQAKRRLLGPPPPPRPLPRAPPRLVDFLPKENSRPVLDYSPDSALIKCNVEEEIQEIEINGEKERFLGTDMDTDPQADSIRFDENLKEKIAPLKNLNPKLISLFEHSQPSDNVIKTSQSTQVNNKFWSNDEKCRKSVKDKIALFSSEFDDENKVKKIQVKDWTEKKAPRKLQASLSVPAVLTESNNTSTKRNDTQTEVETSQVPKVIKHVEEVKPVAIDNAEAESTHFIDKTNKNVTNISLFHDDASSTPKLNNSIISNQIQVKTTTCSNNYTSTLPESNKKTSSYKEKNVSKLRGLVIPKPQSRVSSSEQILDLPEIKSASLFTKTDLCSSKDEFRELSTKHIFQAAKSSNKNVCLGFEWESRFENDLPKYSPAFKRKALSVFEIRSQCAEQSSTVSPISNENSNSSWPNSLKQRRDFEYDKKSKDDNLLVKSDTDQKITEEQYSSSLVSKSIGQMDTETVSKERESISYTDMKKDDTQANSLQCLTTAQDHSDSSSLTSNCSQYSNNLGAERNNFEGKLDSLLSQDMSDSGNHSIPSNYSKFKGESSDESMGSLINGEIQDSDHTSMNSSSDDGQFMEFIIKNNNPLHSDLNSSSFFDANTLKTTSYRNDDGIDQSKQILSERCLSPLTVDTINDSLTPISNDIRDINNVTYKDWQQSVMDQTDLLRSQESKENNDSNIFKAINPEKNNFNVFINKKQGVKDYSTDNYMKDSINEENVIHFNSQISDLQKENHFASITSLASSTSLISHQELCQLIEESNDASIDDGSCSSEISVVVLHRDTAEASIGITLAGGIDYECKDITVHKVLLGSPADRDGRIKKGQRILSINGKSMKGLTHSESLAVLKAPRHEVVLVVARSIGDIFEENNNISRTVINPTTDLDCQASPQNQKCEETGWGPVIKVTLIKEGAGLGFSLKGGKHSPYGDQPLTIQKIFTGGCAEKSKQIFAGDELLSINDTDTNGMTRVEAWTMMKRLPDGNVSLKIRHPAQN